jgi:hypothetical protein
LVDSSQPVTIRLRHDYWIVENSRKDILFYEITKLRRGKSMSDAKACQLCQPVSKSLQAQAMSRLGIQAPSRHGDDQPVLIAA